MSLRRCLFVLSADFGEYVTASVFSRGQPFESHFALPARIARYAGDALDNATVYAGIEELRAIAERVQPDVVALCSGYLFAVNGLIAPAALARWMAELRGRGMAVATTDPWLRIWSMKPGARLAIHSVRKGGVDAALSEKMSRLQAGLEDMFRDVPHLFAVPLPATRDTWMSFYNPQFTAGSEVAGRKGKADGLDDWLFVLSREDYVFLAGFEGERFFRALEDRVAELAAYDGNRLTFIGPPEMGRFFSDRLAGRPRVTYLPFCDFTAFEWAVRRAKIVAYWNVLSASLLYCLYYRVPPIFLGRGHQARVCDGLFEHVAEWVYRGRPPDLIDLNAPFGTRADALIERRGIRAWLDSINRNYAQAPTPATVVERVIAHYAGR